MKESNKTPLLIKLFFYWILLNIKNRPFANHLNGSKVKIGIYPLSKSFSLDTIIKFLIFIFLLFIHISFKKIFNKIFDFFFLKNTSCNEDFPVDLYFPRPLLTILFSQVCGNWFFIPPSLWPDYRTINLDCGLNNPRVTIALPKGLIFSDFRSLAGLCTQGPDFIKCQEVFIF